MTKEMGRPIKEARAEVEKCAWVMDYFADNGKIFLNDEVINTDARKSVVTFEPLGVIGSIYVHTLKDKSRPPSFFFVA